jgi:signal transduction histidine kinase
VEIEEKLQEHAAIIQIQDNGEGIAPEMQPKIFTPNFTTKSSGTGLGLAMCKSIVEQSGGAIWFKTAQGIGTTFYVSLPIIE